MSQINKNFTFRGSPSQDQDFYMIAVLKKENISKLQNSNPNLFSYLGIEQDKYFFLCHNQYYDEISSKHYHRLYWSADPDDFQQNFTSGYQNSGVTKVNLISSNGQPVLRYRSHTKGYSTPTIYSRYHNMAPNLNSLEGNEASFPIIINQKKKNENQYNVDPIAVYYSIPYSIENTNTFYNFTSKKTYNSIDWVFRKYQETPETAGSTEGISLGKPKDKDIVYSKNIFNFVDLGNLDTTEGTDESYFNYGSSKYYSATGTASEESEKGNLTIKIHFTGGVEDIENFPLHNGLIKIENDTDESTIVLYNTVTIYDENKYQFNINKNCRGLLGEDINILNGNTLTFYFNQRNSEDCFTTLTNDSTFSNWFDIYFIPVEENAYFPGGIQIGNHQFFPTNCSTVTNNPIIPKFLDGFPTTNIKFFSHETTLPYRKDDLDDLIINPNSYYKCDENNKVTTYNHYKDLKYRKIYNLFMFFILGALDTTYWKLNNIYPVSTAGFDSFPSIAEYDQPMTFFIWDNYSAAKSAYMYNYCQGNERCGFCFGKNDMGESVCFTDRLTRKNASLTSTSNVLVPLTGKERPTGTHSNPGKQFPIYAIFITVFTSIILVLFLIFLFRAKRNERLKRKK